MLFALQIAGTIVDFLLGSGEIEGYEVQVSEWPIPRIIMYPDNSMHCPLDLLILDFAGQQTFHLKTLSLQIVMVRFVLCCPRKVVIYVMTPHLRSPP